jgi:hypothetical protein
LQNNENNDRNLNNIPNLSKRRVILGVFDLFNRGRAGRNGDSKPNLTKETRAYDQFMDELMLWNIDHTDILSILRDEVEEERLTNWSLALEKGIRRGLGSPLIKSEENPLLSIYVDLFRFVKKMRSKLLTNPTMKNAKGTEKLDALSVCIICGIRALQKERGAPRLMTTLQWRLIERYMASS